MDKQQEETVIRLVKQRNIEKVKESKAGKEKPKKEFKSIAVNIPMEIYEIVEEFNRNNMTPLKLTKVCKLAISAEIEKIISGEYKKREIPDYKIRR